MEDNIFFIITNTSIAIPLFLHLFGIYCLYIQRDRQDKQKIFLYSLSTCEVITILVWGTWCTFKWLSCGNQMAVNMLSALGNGVYLTFFLIMLIITLDRLVCVLLHIKYNYYITNKVVCKAMYACYAVGALASTLLTIADDKQMQKAIIYTAIALDCVFILTALLSYTGIAFVLNRHRKEFSHQKGNKHIIKKQHVIPGFIIASYILFHATPNVLFAFTGYSGESRYVQSACWALGVTLDPCIYIFLSEKTRNVALNITKCGRKKNPISNPEAGSSAVVRTSLTTA